MSKRILWAVFSLFGAKAIAQQQPHYTQYIMNQYVINPAITGIENYTDIRLSHRHQWAGFDGHPVTSYVTAHRALGKSDTKTTATSFSLDRENPRGRDYWENYRAARPHHGIGAKIVVDRTGPLSNLTAGLTYAYHLGLTTKTSISAGFGFGVNHMSIDGTKINFGGATVDPVIYTSNELRKYRPDVSAGLYLYSADYFVGVSAQQVVPQRMDFSNNRVAYKKKNLLPHLFITSGYRFLLTDDFNLIPSFMFKYFQGVPLQTEFNAKLQFRDFAWVGASYRKDDAFAGMVGINLSNTVIMGYSYDYSTSNLNNFSRGSHEFLLGFMIAGGFDGCPRNVW